MRNLLPTFSSSSSQQKPSTLESLPTSNHRTNHSHPSTHSLAIPLGVTLCSKTFRPTEYQQHDNLSTGYSYKFVLQNPTMPDGQRRGNWCSPLPNAVVGRWSPLESDSTDSGLETATISFFGPSDNKRIRIKLIPTDVFLRPSTDLISSEGFL